MPRDVIPAQCVRNLGIYRDVDLMMRTHVQRTNSIAVLRRPTSTTTDLSTSTEGHSSDAGSRAGPLMS